MSNYNDYYSEFLSRLLNDDLYPEEEQDEADEEYNIIDDLINNNQDYKYDKIPYNFQIPKKEIEEINKISKSIIHKDETNQKSIENSQNENDSSQSDSSSDKEIKRRFSFSNKKHRNLGKKANDNQSHNKINESFTYNENNLSKKYEVGNNEYNIHNQSRNLKNIYKKGMENVYKSSNIMTNNINQNTNMINTSNNHKEIFNKQPHFNKKVFFPNQENSHNTQNNNNEYKVSSNNIDSSVQNQYYKDKHSLRNGISFLNQNYPNTFSFSNQNYINNNITSSNTIDLAEIIRISLKYYDLYIQLIIQTACLSNNMSIKNRCLLLLNDLYKIKEQIIDFLNLPRLNLEIDFLKSFNYGKPLKISPQMSFFQAPILEILPLIENIMRNTWSIDQCRMILKEFIPFVNVYYLPVPKKMNNLGYDTDSDYDDKSKIIKNQKFNNNLDVKDKNLFEDLNYYTYSVDYGKGINSNKNMNTNTISDSYNTHHMNKEYLNNKTQTNFLNSNTYSASKSLINQLKNSSNIKNKLEFENTFLSNKRLTFDRVYDNLLLIGQHIFGRKNVDQIKKNLLSNKTISEIKHRIKNLCCQKASENIIKTYKLMSEKLPSEDEFSFFLKGIKWFGINNKWNLISRYFIPERTPEYIESLFKILVDLGFFSEFYYMINGKKKKRRNKELNSDEKYINNLAKDSINEINSISNGDLTSHSHVLDTIQPYYEKIFLNEEYKPSYVRRYGDVDVVFLNTFEGCYEQIELD